MVVEIQDAACMEDQALAFPRLQAESEREGCFLFFFNVGRLGAQEPRCVVYLLYICVGCLRIGFDL